MTRTPHDQFAKQHLEALLEAIGSVTSSRKVVSETREVDIWFVPDDKAQATRAALGILGQMVSQQCVLEPFRNAVQAQDIRTCLGKLIDLSESLRRKARRDQQPFVEAEFPKLWILSPTVSNTLIEGFGLQQRAEWPQGFYFLPPMLHSALIAIHQLPVTPATLWLRLMGRNSVQRRAISELLTLPSEAPLKQQAIENLAVLQISLNLGQNLSEDDRELAMNLTPAYIQWRQETLQQGRQEGLQQGRREGRQEGRQEGMQEGLQQERSLILKLLNRKIGPIPAALMPQLEALPLSQLEALGEALLDFSNLRDLTDWLQSLK
jgi:hypothetical protein